MCKQCSCGKNKPKDNQEEISRLFKVRDALKILIDNNHVLTSLDLGVEYTGIAIDIHNLI